MKLQPSDFVEDDAIEFGSDGGPEEVAAGYFVYASAIDWDAGSLDAFIEEEQTKDEHLFWDAEHHLTSQFREPEYVVSLKGFCFERNYIEMLQPGFELTPEKRELTELPAKRGRPRIWDWEGATTHLLTLAQHPDGLPTGPGAQAQMERAISDWFMEETGNTPAPSQVRKHASKIMRAIEKPKSR